MNTVTGKRMLMKNNMIMNKLKQYNMDFAMDISSFSSSHAHEKKSRNQVFKE